MHTLKKFIQYYAPYKKVFFLDLICAAVISLVDLAFPQILRTLTKTLFTESSDVILRASHAMPEQVQQMFADEFEKNDIWKHFAAVQNGRVYDLDSSLFGMSANFSYQQALEALQPMLYNN